jgi:hypothetical protein
MYQRKKKSPVNIRKGIALDPPPQPIRNWQIIIRAIPSNMNQPTRFGPENCETNELLGPRNIPGRWQPLVELESQRFSQIQLEK